MIAIVVMAVALSLGVAWALNVNCALDPLPACNGTKFADELEGEDIIDTAFRNADTINGLGGSDGADGKGGDDKIYGGEGNDGFSTTNDVLEGGLGKDTVDGGPGDDGIGPAFGGLTGSAGYNTVIGGTGYDTINAQISLSGEIERIFGGNNDDIINADEGERDFVDCGPGADFVDADPTDVVFGNCEVVV